jgi:hypothetical protein
MINRLQWKKLKQMSPGVQFWEKRAIVFRHGGYHQNDVQGFLKTLEWAIHKHQQQDKEEEDRK